MCLMVFPNAEQLEWSTMHESSHLPLHATDKPYHSTQPAALRRDMCPDERMLQQVCIHQFSYVLLS